MMCAMVFLVTIFTWPSCLNTQMLDMNPNKGIFSLAKVCKHV